ncbi:gap junction delta-4 protein [Vicugna pacos]|uniref:Gap junction protein n=1 Tax=Vicugna pacos TaxID=30538 RepID=A0A6I9IN18_VICPA
MDRPDLLGFLAITLSCNVTVVGKIWLVFMVLLRMVVLVLAGSPVYQDEQERFVCNTLQPGCANVCYDIFSPVSHLRFWLLHSVSVLLPSAVFSVYVLHKGAELAARGPRGPDGVPGDHHAPELTPGARHWLLVPDFSSGYLVHLCLRTLTEAAFGALHYLLFGFLVPKRFSCTHPPCTSVVDCYVSRPTEKSILMLFVWAACALSFLLSVADLVCSARWKTRGRPGRATRRPWPVAGDAALEGHRDGVAEGRGARARPGPRTEGQGAHSPAGMPAARGRLELPGEDESDALSSASDQLPVPRPREAAAAGREERPGPPRAPLPGPGRSEWV